MGRYDTVSSLIVVLHVTAFGATREIVQSAWKDGVYLCASPARLTPEDLPAALAVTSLLGGSLALDRITRRNLLPYQDTRSAQTLRTYGDYAQFAGPLLGGLFAASGWAFQNDEQKSAAWDLVESFAWANALGQVSKITLGRRRPNATDDPFELRPGTTGGAFPSGHTTSAFAAAVMISEHYPTWKVSVPAYAAAGAVAFSRIYANQHWGSDVVGGALLGYGVSHALWKRHHRRSESCWNWDFGTDGLRLSKRF